MVGVSHGGIAWRFASNQVCVNRVGRPVIGSHALVSLGVNIKRVNRTQESICASVLVNSIRFCFHEYMLVCKCVW